MPRLPVAERRDQIAAAAVAVALREGIDHLTTRRVAAEAGVAVGVLHYTFGTRDALLREVITRLVSDTSRSMGAVIGGGGDLETLLNRSVEAFCTAIETDSNWHLLTYEISTWVARNPEFAELGTWMYGCCYRAVEDLLERLAEAAQVRWSVPVPALARMVLAQMEGVTLTWLIDRDGTRARMNYATFMGLVSQLAVPEGSRTR